MAEDFKINIGVTGDGAGTQGTKGTESAMAFGVNKGLKMAGVVGLLSSLKIVTDTIGVIMQLVGAGIVQMVGFLGALLGLFISKVVGFFEDPTRYLLQFGLFIVNGIITGLEMVLNGILGIFGMDKIELPRFQTDMVLSAYDEYRDTINSLASEGRSVSADSFNATIKFMQDLGKSFMKNSEYQELLEQRARDAQEKTNLGIDSVSVLADALQAGSDASVNNFSSAFSSVDKLAQELKKRSEQSYRRLTGGSGGSGAISSSSNTAINAINNALAQSTTLTEQQASSGLYLLNKLGGQ